MYSFFDFNFGDVAIAHLLPHYTPEEMPEISPRRLEPRRPSNEKSTASIISIFTGQNV
jgi:hypothetical protein